MPRKKEKQKEWTQMQIKRSVLKQLSKLKIHPRQTYSEVIEGLIQKFEEMNTSRKIEPLSFDRIPSLG